MPFPPPATKLVGLRRDKANAGGGHVEELDFESTVDSIESLETMLDPLLHSVALLEKEKAKEEAALERDYETLRTLESNAKAEARGWRERMRKAHPLAPEPGKQKDMHKLDLANGEGLELAKQKSTPLSGVFQVSNYRLFF
jgi:FtsZ-binding cell division protein ZapB